MKLKKCTEEYFELKKEQYLKVAKYISEMIKKAGLNDCQESFEIVKEMIINNEGLSLRKNLFDAFIWHLQMILPWIPVIVTVLSSIIIDFVSEDKSLFMSRGFWSILLLFFLCGFLLDLSIRTISIKNENMYLRFLKSMHYEQYKYILDEFLNEQEEGIYLETEEKIGVKGVVRNVFCILKKFYEISKIGFVITLMIVSGLHLLAYITKCFFLNIIIPTFLYYLVPALLLGIWLVVSIIKYKDGDQYFNSISYLVKQKSRIKDQYKRAYEIKKCIENFQDDDDNCKIRMNILVLEASIAYDETFATLSTILVAACSFVFSNVDIIFLLYLGVWLFLLIEYLAFVLPRNAFIKKVLIELKEEHPLI